MVAHYHVREKAKPDVMKIKEAKSDYIPSFLNNRSLRDYQVCHIPSSLSSVAQWVWHAGKIRI